MRVIVIGCGRMGAELAARLYQRGHEVSVVDENEFAFTKLPPNFEGRLNEGEALNRDVLHRAGIERADTVAVVTDLDVLNAVVGHLARDYYKVPNVVVRNHDPRYRSILEAFNLQMVSAMSWGAQRMEEMLYGTDVRVVFSAGNGEVEVYEMSIPDQWKGHKLEELTSPETCVPVSVTRAGRAMMPSPSLVLETGDVINMSATMEGAEALNKRLGNNKGQ